eukprot:GFUD01009081.1.p1 GENE.GFUD01009081.1~~GFUD01009081.1.p1  ORF type:complete len:378 (-),score=154.50 GFUD01009081.1:210-1271(-)
MSDILLYLTVCGKGWLVIYLSWLLINSLLTSLTLHLMAVGLSICVVAALKLPDPDKDTVRMVLGEEPDRDDQETAAWSVAHRAAGLDAPENSLEAVRLAAKNGAKWVEFDVSFSSDLTGVAFHDDTLDRVTMTSGQVNSLTYTQLTKLDLAPKHPLSASYNHVRIPSVEQFVAECLKLDLKIIIDLKTWDLPDETVNLILSLHSKFPTLKTNSIVTSFFPNLLYKLRSSDPNIVVAVSTRPHFHAFSTWEGISSGMRPRFSGMKQWLAMCLDMVYTPMLEQLLWWLIGISAVLVHRAVVTREYVDMWRKKGVRVMAWTVNCPIEKQFMRRVLGVKVLTDTMEKVIPDRWRVEM